MGVGVSAPPILAPGELAAKVHFHVSGLGIWERPEDDEVEIRWVRWLAGRMKALGVGGTYVNYTAPDEPPDRARSPSPEGLHRR